MEQEEKLKKMKNVQGKECKRARGKKLKGAGSKWGNCEWSKEQRPPNRGSLT